MYSFIYIYIYIYTHENLYVWTYVSSIEYVYEKIFDKKKMN
jgi:hypothetical protein